MKGQKIMTEVKRHVEIAGYGVYLPKNTVQFKDQTRYRVVENEETQLDLAEAAIQRALENANLNIKDIDCLVSASAVGVQPIPCTAALIHERVAKDSLFQLWISIRLVQVLFQLYQRCHI